MVSPLVRCITVFRPGLEWAPLSDRLVVSSWVLFSVSTHRVIITSRVWLSIRCWCGKYQRLNLLQDLLERCCIEKYFSQWFNWDCKWAQRSERCSLIKRGKSVKFLYFNSSSTFQQQHSMWSIDVKLWQNEASLDNCTQRTLQLFNCSTACKEGDKIGVKISSWISFNKWVWMACISYHVLILSETSSSNTCYPGTM